MKYTVQKRIRDRWQRVAIEATLEAAQSIANEYYTDQLEKYSEDCNVRIVDEHGIIQPN